MFRRSRLSDTTPCTSIPPAGNSPNKTNLPLYPVVISNNGSRGQMTKSSTHHSSSSSSSSSSAAAPAPTASLLLPLLQTLGLSLHPPGPSIDTGRRLVLIQLSIRPILLHLYQHSDEQGVVLSNLIELYIETCPPIIKSSGLSLSHFSSRSFFLLFLTHALSRIPTHVKYSGHLRPRYAAGVDRARAKRRWDLVRLTVR